MDGTRRAMVMRAARGAAAGLLVAAAVASAAAQSALPLETQLDMAIVRLERAVTAGDHLATLQVIAELRAIDPSAAIGDLLYFEAAAALGAGRLPEAQTAITTFLHEVGRSSSNYDAALEVAVDIEQAIEEIYQDGVSYLYGFEPHEKDIDAAMRPLLQAAELGHGRAQEHLGNIYYWGYLGDPDFVQSAHWFKKAAAQGLTDAIYYVGRQYYNGEGLPHDLSEAFRLFKMSMDIPSKEDYYKDKSQQYLAIMYLRGQSVAQDSAEAARLILPLREKIYDGMVDILVYDLRITAEEARELGLDPDKLKLDENS